MNPLSTSATASIDPEARTALWRRALAGLSPKVIAFVAAFMLARTLGTSFDGGPLWAREDQSLAETWQAYWRLLAMAAPMLLVIIATANLGPQRGPTRVVALSAAVIVSSGVGTLLRMFMMWDSLDWGSAMSFIPYVWSRYALLAGMLTAIGEFHRREVASTAAIQRAEIDHAAFEREMAEARLQVLQAQIEPHFLFNTLANVRRLYDQDHTAGRTMLDNLMRYLEVALPHMRHNESTLGRDSELVEAFLHIQQIRMGHRLDFSIDIPAELRAHYVPPMMLLTLVENAIKHGINPSRKGGRIRVMARADGARIILSVADTGVGFAPGVGTGTGLANVCARLAAQFGNRADFALENNELGGATAIIALPRVGAA